MAQLLRLADHGADSRRHAWVQSMLVQGGDERICIDPSTGENRYGCSVLPDPDVAAFGSSTASVISAPAYAAVCEHAARLRAFASPREAYAIEAGRLRERLARACGLPPRAAADIVLAASGTDLHMIAADLARGETRAPLVCILPDPAETGRGVPDALRSARHSSLTPHGSRGVKGELLPGGVAAQLIATQVREPDGSVRDPAAVDQDFERACERAVKAGARVLLVAVDVSKTGLIAPSPACAVTLKQRFGEAVTVLVDACQFRISDQTLARYLAQNVLVAVTGSKFVGGPAFSGALFIPEASADRLRGAPLLPALGDYSGRQDWPEGYLGRNVLPDLPNLGLLLRWHAALHELEAFRALPEAVVCRFLRSFASAVETRLDDDPRLERIAAPPIDRDGWDAIPTIFPFLVSDERGPLSEAQTLQVYRQHGQLGQPVAVGARGGQALSALRLSVSARLVVEALSREDGERDVIDRAMHALSTIGHMSSASEAAVAIGR